MTTMKGKKSILTPARDKITVKNSVDKPIIRANVPIKENRNFHKFTKFSLIMWSKDSRL